MKEKQIEELKTDFILNLFVLAVGASKTLRLSLILIEKFYVLTFVQT